jgi:hypothetical protein
MHSQAEAAHAATEALPINTFPQRIFSVAFLAATGIAMVGWVAGLVWVGIRVIIWLFF